MVSIQVSKGQGLTQALQTYAKNNGYDISGIDKKDWENTIFKLEKIQDSREKNNETSIYTKVETTKPYADKLVHEGNIEFSDAELQSLLQAMGLETKADAYENWNTAVSKKVEEKHGDFQLKSDDSHDENAYNNDLAELATDYIKKYDTNDDGKISYDEFEAYEVKHTKDNAENESEADADIEAAKASLKTIFNHLNVDTESSKDNLDKEEIMNYFFSMDSLDSEKYTADGYVSQNSYIKMQNALADDENVEQKDKDGNVIKKDDRQGNMIFEFLKRNYNKDFKKLK